LWIKTPETAARLRGRIEVVLDAARAVGHIEESRANPARWRGHLDKLLPKRQRLTRGHHAALDYRDLPEFVQRLRGEKGTASLALEFVILTCTRSGETLNATWSEIDTPAATWTIPAHRTKIGKEHLVPLSKRALAILDEARRLAKKEPTPDRYVFPGGLPKQPLSGMAMAMLLRRMGVKVTSHGFRSTARSWMADTGVPFEVAEQCLGHTVGNAVVRAYLRTNMLERRRPVLEAWAAYVGGEDDANANANAKVVQVQFAGRAPGHERRPADRLGGEAALSANS
jgi:integrase